MKLFKWLGELFCFNNKYDNSLVGLSRLKNKEEVFVTKEKPTKNRSELKISDLMRGS